MDSDSTSDPAAKSDPQPVEYSNAADILAEIKAGRLLTVDSRRRSGLLLYKPYHSEFAGPGAAVGGCFDLDCEDVLPVGDLSVVEPTSHEQRQKCYMIRRQWIRLTHQFTDGSTALERAQKILNQFEGYFDRETIAQIPDDAFAMMVGVVPHTVRLARRPLRRLNVRSKAS
ncbi:MAG: hypothetical protein WBA10_20665 [Elainellaceae cyanobacterium]